jgi:hypothetical protein
LGEGDAGTEREQQGDTHALQLHDGRPLRLVEIGWFDCGLSVDYTLLLRLHCECDGG